MVQRTSVRGATSGSRCLVRAVSVARAKAVYGANRPSSRPAITGSERVRTAVRACHKGPTRRSTSVPSDARIPVGMRPTRCVRSAEQCVGYPPKSSSHPSRLRTTSPPPRWAKPTVRRGTPGVVLWSKELAICPSLSESIGQLLKFTMPAIPPISTRRGGRHPSPGNGRTARVAEQDSSPPLTESWYGGLRQSGSAGLPTDRCEKRRISQKEAEPLRKLFDVA